ncbi:uncharacterized protein LOC128164821 [Crassostrea angulata]|uniref:uncharacterized protein LOC128164821 n=1 Tax=Magallana angulata TaxID=2784310 RepID=UPI0022B1D360|nr:uncharacterized protein LOC128164821 [Crassostrea angulata]
MDFKAKVVNKKVQAWMPLGVPTGEDWLLVTRNLNVFEQLQQNLEEMMGSTESSDVPSTRRMDVEEQVFSFRTLIRRKVYLLYRRDASANPISLGGKLLSNDQFHRESFKLACFLFNRYMGLAEDSDTHKMYVCVTKEEEARLLLET